MECAVSAGRPVNGSLRPLLTGKSEHKVESDNVLLSKNVQPHTTRERGQFSSWPATTQESMTITDLWTPGA